MRLCLEETEVRVNCCATLLPPCVEFRSIRRDVARLFDSVAGPPQPLAAASFTSCWTARGRCVVIASLGQLGLLGRLLLSAVAGWRSTRGGCRFWGGVDNAIVLCNTGFRVNYPIIACFSLRKLVNDFLSFLKKIMNFLMEIVPIIFVFFEKFHSNYIRFCCWLCQRPTANELFDWFN